MLADDHELLARGMRILIGRQADWEVCGMVSNGIAAVDEAKRLTPDILIVDLKMPGLDGLEVTRQVKLALPDCEVMVCTGTNESDEIIRKVFAAGAKCFLHKTDCSKFLIEAIKSLSEHKPFFTDKASSVVFARFNLGNKNDSRLSEEETIVVRLLAEGSTNAEVATHRGVSVRTIENMRAGIMKKLQLRTLPDLVRYAVQNDIIKV